MTATDVAIKPEGLWLKMAHQIQRLVLDGLHQTSPEVFGSVVTSHVSEEVRDMGG